VKAIHERRIVRGKSIEYVENQEQIDVLLCLGCHIFQGYFYSPPISGEKILQYVFEMNRKREGED
jgi:EAL domain-containing protein (putative c-di-GMP-specific phosphodiesterase class I)